MSEAFLYLSAEEQADILQTYAGKLGRRAEHLEKDVWICWVLQGLFGMPGRLPMAFKGGTALSKVHGAIGRFSEDVDGTVEYISLDKSIDPSDKSKSGCWDLEKYQGTDKYEGTIFWILRNTGRGYEIMEKYAHVIDHQQRKAVAKRSAWIARYAA